MIHFGAGDLLRDEIKKQSDQGKYIESIIKEGKIVPVKITCGLIKQKMEENGKDKLYLIDGYPRNKDNIDGWMEVFDGSEGKKSNILCLLNLDCSLETCVNRLKNRGLSSGRSDDDEEVIKKRINTFLSESKQVTDLMGKEYKIITISTETSPEEVLKKACEELEKLI